jgi:hypothetical protein
MQWCYCNVNWLLCIGSFLLYICWLLHNLWLCLVCLTTSASVLLQVSVVKNEALDVAAVVAQYQLEVEGLKAQLAALTGGRGHDAVCIA